MLLQHLKPVIVVQADLIGMKLMALAGYNPEAAPETFRKLGAAEQAMRRAMGGNLQALQCTHPRSAKHCMFTVHCSYTYMC